MTRPQGPSIYRITTDPEWRADQAASVLSYNADDRRDGYLHFSTADQVAETIMRHRAGVKDRIVLEVDAGQLGANLRWEASRGGAWFPHLYGPCPTAAVIGARSWPDDRENGDWAP